MDENMRTLVNYIYWQVAAGNDRDIAVANVMIRHPEFFLHQVQQAYEYAVIGRANVQALTQLTEQETGRYLGGKRQTAQGQRIALENAPLSTFATAGSPHEGAVVVRVLLTYQGPMGIGHRMVTLDQADWSETPGTLKWYAAQLWEQEEGRYGSHLTGVDIIGPLI